MKENIVLNLKIRKNEEFFWFFPRFIRKQNIIYYLKSNRMDEVKFLNFRTSTSCYFSIDRHFIKKKKKRRRRIRRFVENQLSFRHDAFGRNENERWSHIVDESFNTQFFLYTLKSHFLFLLKKFWLAKWNKISSKINISSDWKDYFLGK